MTAGKYPKTCECGGRLVYSDGPGRRTFVYCKKCTPVVKVRLPGLATHLLGPHGTAKVNSLNP